MKNKSIKDVVLFRILLLGVGIAILIWSIDILVDVFLFNKGDIIQQIFAPEPFEIYFRWTVWSIIVIFSIYAQSMINKHKQAEDAVGESRDYLQTLFDNMEEDVLTIDKDYRILSANRSFLKTSGLSLNEVIGKQCYVVSHNMKEPCDSSQHLCPLREVLETGRSSMAVHTHFDKDGNEIYVDITASPIKDEEGNVVALIEVARDITEKYKAEETFYQRFDQLQAIYRLRDAISMAGTVEEIYEEALDALLERMLETTDRASVLLFDQDGVMRFKAWRGLSESYRKAVEGYTPWQPEEKDPRPVLVSNVEEEPSLEELRRVIIGEGIHALGFIPLVSREQLLGKFGVYYNTPHEFRGEEIQTAQTIASHIAFAIDRKQAEEALRESEKQYRILFNSGDDVVLLHGLTEDSMPGKFIEVNNVACQRLGYTREELLELSPADIEASEKYKDIPNIMEKLLANKHVLFETVHITKDRRRIFVEINAHLFELKGQHTVLSIARDITKRKQEEEEMIEREQEAVLLQKMNSMLSVSTPKEKIFSEISRELTSTFGYDLSAILIPSEDLKYLKIQSYYIDSNLLKNTENILSAGVLFMSYFAILTGKKATDYNIPLYEGSFYQRLVKSKEPIFTDDIEALVRAHTDKNPLQALAPAIAKLSGMKYGMGAPLLAGDRLVGIIGVANKKELTQKDAERLASLGKQIGSSVERAISYEELEGAYRELQKSALQLKEINQLKDLFTDIMTHDLLGPAGAIRNSAELMLHTATDEERELLEIIEWGAEKQIETIETASKLSMLKSVEELERESLDLKEVIDKVVDDTRHLFEAAGMRVEKRVTKPMPLNANSVIGGVFFNLLSNAAKYAANSEKVVIEAIEEDESYTVTVKDYGSGIPDENKENIFERFTREKKEGVKGTGLGLAIAKRVMDMHGGKIWVEDNPEGGSIFYVNLPK